MLAVVTYQLLGDVFYLKWYFIMLKMTYFLLHTVLVDNAIHNIITKKHNIKKCFEKSSKSSKLQ